MRTRTRLGEGRMSVVQVKMKAWRQYVPSALASSTWCSSALLCDAAAFSQSPRAASIISRRALAALGVTALLGVLGLPPTGAHFDSTVQPSGIAGSMSGNELPQVPAESSFGRPRRLSLLATWLPLGALPLGANQRPGSVGRIDEPHPLRSGGEGCESCGNRVSKIMSTTRGVTVKRFIKAWTPTLTPTRILAPSDNLQVTLTHLTGMERSADTPMQDRLGY